MYRYPTAQISTIHDSLVSRLPDIWAERDSGDKIMAMQTECLINLLVVVYGIGIYAASIYSMVLLLCITRNAECKWKLK